MDVSEIKLKQLLNENPGTECGINYYRSDDRTARTKNKIPPTIQKKG